MSSPGIRPFCVAARRLSLWLPLGIACCLLAFAGDSTAEDEDSKRRQDFLPHHLPRNRRLRETLASVNSLQAHGRVAESLKALQWVFDQPHDAFAFTEQKRPVSVKGQAESRLRSLPLEWRQLYERTYGPEARLLLEDARHRDDERFAVEVLRRYATTEAADDAALWLAQRWLDRGELPLALGILIPDDFQPAALKPLPSRRLQAAEIAAELAGRAELAADIRRELDERAETPPNPGKQRPDPPPARALVSRERREQLQPAVDSDRSLSSAALPVLRPQWMSPLAAPRNQTQLAPALNAWRSQLQGMNLAPVVPQLPLVVRAQLIARTNEGVGGYELQSGRPLWAFACESSLANWLDDAARQRRDEGAAKPVVPAESLQLWFSGNSLMGYLSSDGVRLYLVDALAHPSVRPTGKQDPFQARQTETDRLDETNRLLALELPAEANGPAASPRLVWSYGRTLRSKDPRERARYFFGPPTPHAGRLLSLVEFDREIRLLALQPETGQTLWEQPLAAVDRAAIHDGERAFTACLPIPAGNLIVCPTQAGVLAAVDSVTGQLRWAYYDADLPADPMGRQRGGVIARPRPGFAPRTLVHGPRIVHLPLNSSVLHVLELETGQPLRTIPRQRACSLAAVTDELAILLEDQACRAVRLADGSDAWRQALPPITGTGIVLGSQVVIPVDQGRFAALDLATGEPSSWQPPRRGAALGNLTVCGDLVLSLGPDGVTAFPQAQALRRTLRDDAARLSPVEKAVMTADLQLVSGQLADAEQSLETALAATLPVAQRGELQELLRELLYHRLEGQPDDSGELLLRLKQLALTDEERGRFIARQARWSITTKDLSRLRAALEELANLPAETVFPSAESATWKQASAACCRQLLAEIESEFPEFVREFREELLSRASQRQTPANGRFAQIVCGDESAAGRLRDAMARQHQRAGRLHAAELLWLQNLHGADDEPAAQAAAGLVELWTDAGWPRDAVRLLNDLSRKWSDVRIAAAKSGRAFVEELPRDHDARQWQIRSQLPRGRIENVSIRVAQDYDLPDNKLQLPVKRSSPRGEPAGPRDREFTKLFPPVPLSADLLLSRQDDQTVFAAVDRSTNQVIHHWLLPSSRSQPAPHSSAFQGHFVPFGVPGELRGYSLLELAEETPAWAARPAELERLSTPPVIGPGGPSFLVFQTPTALYVCQPTDGSPLWQRTDLEPNFGLYSDAGAGIAGDARCLVVFGADRANYVLYDTLTGQSLRAGRLDQEPQQSRRTFGRKILRISREQGQWVARVWDPWTDRVELEEHLGDKNYLLQSVSSAEIVWLTAQGQILGYDIPQAQRTVEAQLEDEDLAGMNSLRILRDGDRYFLNLQRNIAAAQTRDYHSQVDDTTIRSLHVKDDLYAIDGRSGRVLWKRTIPQRTLLRLDPPGLPFLVLLSKVRDRHDTNLQSLLVDVLDAETGELLGRKEHLPPDRLIHAEYDALEQTVTLIGQKSKIELRLAVERGLRPGE